MGVRFAILVVIVTAVEACQVSLKQKSKVYNYNLATPTPNFPHGVLSEDGFYKVLANDTLLWFQLCHGMIFNHHPPSCVDCKDCGGSTRCGMGCSALVAHEIGGYPVCTTIGRSSSTVSELIDINNPQIGITVTMSSSAPAQNCSLKVSVICNSKGFQGPQTIQKMGDCDYVTQLEHPSGCANIMPSGGKAWGWFGTLMMIILCLFGAYFLAGAIYRYYHIGVRGIDVLPNLEFWASIPHRIKSFFMSIAQRYGGPSEVNRSSYSPATF